MRLLHGWWDMRKNLPQHSLLSDYHVGVLKVTKKVDSRIAKLYPGDFNRQKIIRQTRMAGGRPSKGSVLKKI